MNSLSENNNAFDSYVPNLSPQSPSSDNKSDINLYKHTVKEMDVNEIWKKSNFTNRQTNHKHETNADLDPTKMSWNCDDAGSNEEVKNGEDGEKEEVNQTEEIRPHHARRPMNAFLIFCKKHRPIVRNKYLGLENRGVTKILGDWWAQLDVNEKKPYTDLAKEFKDAFFCANPNFKWYKLPAPPLRSLPPRPNNVKQEASPPISPTIQSTPTAEFTPGKLADESQLGMLSTLLKSNNSYNNKQDKQNDTNMCNNNNQMENNNKEYQSPVSNNKDNSILPPKPLKKRTCESLIDNKTITRNLFETKDEEMTDVNMTSYEDDEDDVKNGFKDTRKSGRKCKGQLYAKFMINGKLIKNKRDKNPEPNNLNLNNTINRLAERISCKTEVKPERTRTVSEMSETEDYNKTIPSFDLNKRIDELTSLSYDTYQQRKRESKKRKRVKSRIENKAKVEVVNKGKNLVGSKKRKNKQNITHLEKDRFPIGNDYNYMSGLDTLAAIAASKAKMESDGKSDVS